MSIANEIQELYIGYLGRAADQAGLDYWVSKVNSGWSVNTCAQSFADQPEYKAIYGATTDRATLVTTTYSQLFGRAPDAAGLAYWTTGAGKAVADNLLVATFCDAALGSDALIIQNKVTVSNYYTTKCGNSGKYDKVDAQAAIDGVTASAATVQEAEAEIDIVAAALDTFTLTLDAPSITEGNAGTKDLTFTLSLDKAPAAAVTVNYQTLTSGTATAGDDFGVAAGAVTFAAGQTLATVTVKVNGDTTFEANETVQVTFTGTQLVGAVTATGTITNDDTDISNTPQGFTLTTGIDSGAKFTGGAGDDIFSAVVNNVATPTTTLNPGDSLVGGGGTDILSVVIQDNSAAGVSGFFANGIEKIDIQVADVAGEIVDFQNVSGATTVTSLNSAGTLTVNNAQSNVKTVVQGTNANVTVNYANTLVSGSADTAEIELNGAATTANVAVNVQGQTAGGFETVNVKATGAASGSSTAATAVTVDDGARNTIKTLNVSGDVAARLVASLDGAAATSSTTVGTVNITNTAGVAVNLVGAGGTFVNVTGGDGNDTIQVNNLDSNSTIAGGNGTDTLRVDNVAALAATAFKNVSGFEKIQLGGALTNTQDLTSAGAVTDVVLSAATAGGTISGVASGLNLQMTATGGTNASVLLNNAATSTSDVLNVQVGSTATTTANLAAGTLNISNIETVNLTSSSKEEVTAGNHSITFGTDSALKTLTIAGNESIVVASSGASTLLNSVDASKATSHVNLAGLTLSATAATVTGGAGNDTIQGAAGNDSLTGNAGNDLITAGAGNDVVSGGDGNDTLISGGTGNDKFEGNAGNDRFVFAAAELTSNDTVTGGDGTNTLVFSNTLAGNALTDTAFKNMTNITTITAAANGVAATANDGANNNNGTLEMTLNTAAQAAGITTVAAQFNATTGVTTGTNAIKATVQEGFTNALTFKIGDTAGTDAIAAGATTATITISGSADAFDAADSFVGGSNANDVLDIKADNNTANLTGMRGFETINMLAGTTAGDDVGLTIGSADVLTSGKSLVVNASALTNDGANFTFNGAVEADEGSNTGRFNVTSGAGMDTITGGAGNDTVNSGANADSIYGNAGIDTINAEAGNDYVDGGAGNDVIDGGIGNDTIYGGAGTDNLTGGDGNDTFVYDAQTESAMNTGSSFTGDTIVGFNAGDGTVAGVVDRIQLPTGIAVNTITTVTIGSVNLATFATDLGANGNLTTALGTQGNVAVLTVSSGTAAGSYLVVATTAGAYSNTNSIIVKLQDAQNLDKISTTNFAAPNALTQTANSQVVTGTASGDGLTVSALAPTVVSDLLGGTNTVSLNNGVDISAATYNATGGSISYLLANNGSNTMTIAQNALIGSATGTNTVTLSNAGTATGNSAVETYVLAAGNSTFTIGGTSQAVNASAVGVSTINISGTLGAVTYTGHNNDDTIALATGSNIAAATFTTFDDLTITSGGSVTMAKAQYNQFNTGTITAAGTETITMSDASADGYTLNANVENFVLHSGNDTYVIGAVGQSVNLGAGTNALSSAAGVDALTGTITGGGTDTYTWDDGDDLSGATTIGIDTYASTGDHTVTLDEANMVATAITGTNGAEGNVTFKKTGSGAFNLSAVAMTNIDNIALSDAANGAISLTLDAADINETMTIAGNAGGGVNTIILNDTDDWSGFTITNIDTVNYAATGANTTLTLSDAHFTASNYTTVSATTATSNLTIANADNSAVNLTNTAISGFDQITTGAADGNNADITIDAASISNAAAVTLIAGSTDNLLVTEDVTLSNLTVTAADLDSVVLSSGVDLAVSQNFLSTSITSVTGNGGGTETFTVTASAAASAINISNIATITNLETLALVGGTGNNTITLSATDAVRNITTIDISQGGNDTIVMGTNAAINATQANEVTVTGFGAGSDAAADIVTLASYAGYLNVSGATAAGAQNKVLEVASATATVADFTAVGDLGAVELAIAAGADFTGATDGNDYYVVLYGAGANAGKAALYHMDLTDATGGATEEIMTVELIGVFNGITADAFVMSNFS